MHVGYRVGSRHPLDSGAAGQAILLGRRRERGPGFVVTEGELQEGAVGVAAPILGVVGLEASVGLVAIGRTPDLAAAGPRVIVAAGAIAAALT
jgi:DNA-binding IclR family transcriptional regulator